MRTHSEPPIAASNAATPHVRLAGDRTDAVLVRRRGSQMMNGLSGPQRAPVQRLCDRHRVSLAAQHERRTMVQSERE
jgi:hypothetical protein